MDLQLKDKPDRTLSFKRVRELTDLSRTTVWRLQKTGAFPLPIQISPGRVGWLESEVLAWRQTRTRGELPFAAKPRAKFTAPNLKVAEAAPPMPMGTTAASMERSIEPAKAKPAQRAKRPDPAQLGFAF